MLNWPQAEEILHLKLSVSKKTASRLRLIYMLKECYHIFKTSISTEWMVRVPSPAKFVSDLD